MLQHRTCEYKVTLIPRTAVSNDVVTHDGHKHHAGTTLTETAVVLTPLHGMRYDLYCMQSHLGPGGYPFPARVAGVGPTQHAGREGLPARRPPSGPDLSGAPRVPASSAAVLLLSLQPIPKQKVLPTFCQVSDACSNERFSICFATQIIPQPYILLAEGLVCTL